MNVFSCLQAVVSIHRPPLAQVLLKYRLTVVYCEVPTTVAQTDKVQSFFTDSLSLFRVTPLFIFAIVKGK